MMWRGSWGRIKLRRFRQRQPWRLASSAERYLSRRRER